MSTMTARSFPIFVAILLLVAMQSRTIQSKPSGDPFGFIKHLEGCHRNGSVKGLHELKRYLEKFGYLKLLGNSRTQTHTNLRGSATCLLHGATVLY